MSKDAYYFSHDSNAHKDPRILKLRSKHGWEGYGIYWGIIETLREQNEYKWLANDKQLLTFSFANDNPKAIEVLDDCLDIGLLVVDEEGFIHSESLTRRMMLKEEISEKRREAGRKGGQKSKSKANDKQMLKQNPSNKKKVKESKGKEKESKVSYADRVKMTETEYQNLHEKLGSESVVKDFIERLDLYKGSTGTTYKSDYLTILNWHRKDKPKNKKNWQQMTQKSDADIFAKPFKGEVDVDAMEF